MANKAHPVHADNRKDLQDYVAALRVLIPKNPRDPDYKNQVKAWQKLLNVGKKWHVLRNQEDYPEGSHLFDELGKALSRRK